MCQSIPWHPSLRCTWDPTSCDTEPPPVWQQQSPSLPRIRYFESKYLNQTVSKVADFHKCFLDTAHLQIPISKTMFPKIKLLPSMGFEPTIGMASASQSSALALWSRYLPWNLRFSDLGSFVASDYAIQSCYFSLLFAINHTYGLV